MRKVMEQIASAIALRKDLAIKATNSVTGKKGERYKVVQSAAQDLINVYQWGHHVACIDLIPGNRAILLDHCGYHTVTTRDLLDTVLSAVWAMTTMGPRYRVFIRGRKLRIRDMYSNTDTLLTRGYTITF